MSILSDEQYRIAEAIVEISYCNPFARRRVELEKQALGEQFRDYGPFFHLPTSMLQHQTFRNTVGSIAETLLASMRENLVQERDVSEADVALYRDLSNFLLYHRHLSEVTTEAGNDADHLAKIESVWKDFLHDYQQMMVLPGLDIPALYTAQHLFALQSQVVRAFARIFRHIFGASRPAAQLRTAVWESIFTHDMRRYAQSLYQRMGELPTLITGPSGTGKELVAQAIGQARYIPFDTKTGRFESNLEQDFHAINISAFSSTLVESELFGHSKGSFTGAVSDRKGWLEICSQYGCVFLDEIGELNASTQVILLRVLQERQFQRIGDTHQRRFEGKIISATNRDLVREMEAGRFRADFYYRLCADVVVTPSLRQQLDDNPSDLQNLARHFVIQLVGNNEDLIQTTTAEVTTYIEQHIPDTYPWQGNMRELEQCVRNIVIRGSYQPIPDTSTPVDGDFRTELANQVVNGTLTLDELQARYCSLVVADTGSYRAAAARLASDRRTVQRRSQRAFIERFSAD